MAGLDAWSARVAQRRADERLWAIAQTDARLMADLQGAMNRNADLDILGQHNAQRQAASIIRERLNYI
jgi:hypothetical protein